LPDITLPYIPRPTQETLHRELEAHRFSVIVAHRRAGKTVLCINHAIKQAVLCQKRSPRFGYLAPLYSQAKTVAWDYLKYYTDPIPGIKYNESELWAELPNGSRIRLFGADNPDSLRGQYFDGVILDEMSQMRPELWGSIVRPALTDREGWGIFIGTPMGINSFYSIHQHARKTDGWYSVVLRASETGIISKEELAEAKATMSDAEYRREFECDFSASSEDSLISLDLTQEATHRILHKEAYRHAPIVMGIDVARFGDDESVSYDR